MNKVNELRNRTIILLQTTTNIAKTYKLQEKENKLNYLCERLKKGKTIVLVCGEFKRGKSSFINALIEEPNICPVDIDITTSIATQIHYSEKAFARVHFHKSTGKSPYIISVEDVNKYATEQNNKENKEEVQFVEIGIPKENLNKNLMVIVDTPGVGSLNKKHSEVTSSYLSAADVLLFVCDATAPLTTEELAFIKRTTKYSKNIYFILTKIDMVRGWSQIEEANRKKISECLEKPAESIKIFPVSSLSKLDYLSTQDEESLEDSGFTTLEEQLQQDLRGSIVKNILLDPLLLAKNDTTNIKNSLLMQLQTLQQSNHEKKKAIEEKLSEINDQYKAMQKANSKWQMKFTDSSVDTKRTIRKTINDGFLNLEKELRLKVKDKLFRSDAEGVNAYIKNSILDILRDVEFALGEETSKIKSRITELLGKELDLMLLEIEDIEITELDTSVFEDLRGSGEKVRDVTRAISSNKNSITSLGTLAGKAIFGVVNTVFGVGSIGTIAGIGTGILSVAGGLLGIRSLSMDFSRKQEQEILKACLDILRENKMNCLDICDAQVSNLLSQIREDFYNTIQETMETIEKTKSEINKNLNLTSSQINIKQQKLQEDIKNLSKLENNIAITIEEVQKL